MIDDNTPGANDGPSLIERINEAEPFVAIRFVILQVGLAIAVSIAAAPTNPLPKDLAEFPSFLTGVFDKEALLSFGYPLRELVWSGEVWRLLTGIVLPPGGAYFLLGVFALFVFGRLVEARMGRWKALQVYLAGGLTVVLVDFFSSSGITSGGLGALFAAAGAALGVTLLEKKVAPGAESGVPVSSWVVVLFLWLIAHIVESSAVSLRSTIEFSSSAQIAPSGLALAAAGMTGLCLGVHTTALQLEGSAALFLPEMNPLNPKIVSRLRVLGITWLIGLAFLCFMSWKFFSGIDYQVWKLEVPLRKGDPEAQVHLKNLAVKHPRDLFLQKRLILSYLRNQKWSEADLALNSLYNSILKEEMDVLKERSLAYRVLRLDELGRQSGDSSSSWSYSGLSSNYNVSRERLLWDRGYLARFQGNESRLAEIRQELLEKDPLISEASHIAGSEVEENTRAIRSALLNQHAWARVEFDGDLDLAYVEASASVELDPGAGNLDTLGWVAANQGNFEEAIKALQRASHYKDSKSLGAIHFHLGWTYGQLGEWEKAESHFLMATTFDLDWWDQVVLFDQCPKCHKMMVLRGQ